METKRNGILTFGAGALAGLFAAGVFGYITYPEDPTFEGAGGYHYLAMLFVYPISSLVFGICFYVGFKLRDKHERNKAKD